MAGIELPEGLTLSGEVMKVTDAHRAVRFMDGIIAQARMTRPEHNSAEQARDTILAALNAAQAEPENMEAKSRWRE